jgi:Cu/Ag efflux protein CusF
LWRRRLLAALFAAALLAACRKPVSESAPIRKYSLRGRVVRLDSARRVATIKHEKIEGWMEAMTMDFPVRENRDLTLLSPGRGINATVYVRDLEFWVTDVKPLP